MKRKYNNKFIKNLIESQIDLKIKCIILLGTGSDCEVYLINHMYAFKFPKHESANSNLLREKTILTIISDKVPISVPKILFTGFIPNINYIFYGYKVLEGTFINRSLYNHLSIEDQDNMAKDIAHFLKTLHTIQTSDSLNLSLKTIDKYKFDLEFIEHNYSSELGKEVISKIKDFYYDLFNTSNFFDYNNALIHNDFSATNMLINKKTNKICGIIDFSDTAYSDPDNDFYYILDDSNHELGKDFGLKVLKYYGHNNIDLVIKKADFHKLYWMFDELILGKLTNKKSWEKNALKKIRDYFVYD